MRFSIKDFLSKCDQIRSDLVTFTEEILNGKLYFLCSDTTRRDENSVSQAFENYYCIHIPVFIGFNGTLSFVTNLIFDFKGTIMQI